MNTEFNIFAKLYHNRVQIVYLPLSNVLLTNQQQAKSRAIFLDVKHCKSVCHSLSFKCFSVTSVKKLVLYHLMHGSLDRHPIAGVRANHSESKSEGFRLDIANKRKGDRSLT